MSVEGINSGAYAALCIGAFFVVVVVCKAIQWLDTSMKEAARAQRAMHRLRPIPVRRLSKKYDDKVLQRNALRQSLMRQGVLSKKETMELHRELSNTAHESAQPSPKIERETDGGLFLPRPDMLPPIDSNEIYVSNDEIV